MKAGRCLTTDGNIVDAQQKPPRWVELLHCRRQSKAQKILFHKIKITKALKVSVETPFMAKPCIAGKCHLRDFIYYQKAPESAHVYTVH